MSESTPESDTEPSNAPHAPTWWTRNRGRVARFAAVVGALIVASPLMHAQRHDVVFRPRLGGDLAHARRVRVALLDESGDELTTLTESFAIGSAPSRVRMEAALSPGRYRAQIDVFSDPGMTRTFEELVVESNGRARLRALTRDDVREEP